MECGRGFAEVETETELDAAAVVMVVERVEGTWRVHQKRCRR